MEGRTESVGASGAIDIRAASENHIHGIRKIVSYYAEKEMMLHRSEAELLHHLDEYFVAVIDSEVVGCMGLGHPFNGMSEIKSVAVDANYPGRGIGVALLSHCEKVAKERGYRTIFALTYIPTYFTRAGWRIITKEQLPHKIWTDCMQCSKYYNCTEIAVCKEFTEDTL